jgi:tyrosyl-tRNA synthetase
MARRLAFAPALPLLRLCRVYFSPATRVTRGGARWLACAARPPAGDLLDVLRGRGLLDNVTGSLGGEGGDSGEVIEGGEERVGLLGDGRKAAVYCGFDPTADSLHLGNLLAIMTLAWCQRCGHRPVAIVGGATGRVGDPSGKSAERPVLSDELIDLNLKGIERDIRNVLEYSRGCVDWEVPEMEVMNNADWWGGMKFLDVLRDVGKYVRVGGMLAKESVKKRLESEDGMSFTEFTYQLLQAYDFMYLSDVRDVRIQMGGSDQWGNIIAGIELTRKLREGRTLHGITFPLLTTADGRKFGKSESGAVWLSAEKLSPYEFYQHLFKVPDADVAMFMRRLTFLNLEEIAEIEMGMAEPGYVANTAQRRLAEEVTRIVHGEEGVRLAAAATAAANPGGATALSAEALEAVSNDMPSISLGRGEVVGKGIVDVMVASGLQKSKGEARRLIKGGGGYVNNSKIADEGRLVEESDLVESRLLLLGAGKKRKLLVRVTA